MTKQNKYLTETHLFQGMEIEVENVPYSAFKQLAYGQQKNRERIWRECMELSIELFGRDDYEFVGARYAQKCREANITPW